MKLDHDAEIGRFRAEVRSFIEAHRPVGQALHKAGVRAPDPDDIPALRKWTAQVFDAGYFGGDWPVEWGGTGAQDPLRATVVGEEIARARVPAPLGAGLLAAMSLIHFGRQEQKQRYLPRIRTGEDIWCQLFSEPGAGSDLASLQTRARRDGDCFVINGQKVWTTNGHHAERGYLLARTNPDVPKHAGITAFAIDMDSSGIDVRPLREITGTSDFNEVFFDDVRIPAENVIGAVDRGWEVATTSLVHERSGVGTAGVVLLRAVTDAARMAGILHRGERPAIENDAIRQVLGRLYAAARVNILLGQYNLSRALTGSADAGDAPLAKILYSETNLAVCEFGLGLQGTDSLLTEDDPKAIGNGWWQDAFLYARALTIAGGANEVLRNIIAERALGLPKEPRVS
ncbi:acyl-CoA dehydrogenase family protein [Nocardia sp. NBC_00565]|uniref:acyl-CoA dehydrogenase family protein n=1 Tax=Nocardia sp. NBC_00565 TaxID=2975993 RepID=UPI002E812142|nr:acyl-CoA dehydrogenase family protein [Nocardia sp. NBC_00565]WUC05615.1 acyl-CoA dehydrogenase family protein [Nocardia sp. NBC_00565]